MSPSSASSSSSPPTPPAAANPTTASSSSQPSQPALSYGSQIQMRTRKQNNFAETEASLPRVTQHRGAPLLDDVKARLTASTKLTDLLSYLGPLNPLPLSVARDDAVWLFDNVAFPDPQGDDDAAWRAEFVAAVFEQHVWGCRATTSAAARPSASAWCRSSWTSSRARWCPRGLATARAAPA
ncbi:hypothetical protein VTK73DRAFT_4322 [Phialemonium thermophilum]|uniref:Uncharacterized protein n=1 Tax=Phialemonium thermophilum TaxID=223376 RepID=A0ABR3V9V7_9PEZI